jgi:hypothetical protein
MERKTGIGLWWSSHMRIALTIVGLLAGVLVGAVHGDEGCCDACDPCGCGHGHFLHGRCGHCGGYDPEWYFNCGCNGSYKFPVPSLYTYHWPGMYSAERMTDYHSPWRFPPLRPYTDEASPVVLGKKSALRRIQPASAIVGATRPSRPASFSDRLEESLR